MNIMVKPFAQQLFLTLIPRKSKQERRPSMFYFAQTLCTTLETVQVH